jgi:hypothetical protein
MSRRCLRNRSSFDVKVWQFQAARPSAASRRLRGWRVAVQRTMATASARHLRVRVLVLRRVVATIDGLVNRIGELVVASDSIGIR